MLYIFWKLSTFWIYCAQSFLIQSFTRHLVNDSMVAHLHELHFADQIKCVESEAKQSEPQQILPICLKLHCLALPTSPDPTHLRLNHPLSSGGSNSEQSCVACIRQNCKMHLSKGCVPGGQILGRPVIFQFSGDYLISFDGDIACILSSTPIGWRLSSCSRKGWTSQGHWKGWTFQGHFLICNLLLFSFHPLLHSSCASIQIGTLKDTVTNYNHASGLAN